MPKESAYEKGRMYVDTILSHWRKDMSLMSLIEAVDVYKAMALKRESEFELGMASRLCEYALERKVGA